MNSFKTKTNLENSVIFWLFLFFQTLHNNFNNYYNTVKHCADLRTFPTGEHYVIHVLIVIVCYIHVYTPECKKKTVFRFKSIHASLMSNFLTNNNYGNMLGWNKIKVTDASSMQFDLKLTSNFIIHVCYATTLTICNSVAYRYIYHGQTYQVELASFHFFSA